MGKVLEYIVNAIPYMLFSLSMIVLVRGILLFKIKKNGQKINWYHEIGLWMFILFLVSVASQTIIPKLEFGNVAPGIVNRNLSGNINFIPGMVFVDIYRECFVNHSLLYFVINFVGNICLFLPIGFGIALLWNDISYKKIVCIALAASMLIELCQLPQARGTDIDDLWINALGALLGYLIYRLLLKSSKINTFFLKFKRNS